MEEVEEQRYGIDDVQSNMLGVIVSIMTNYGLTTENVIDRYNYVVQLSNNSYNELHKANPDEPLKEMDEEFNLSEEKFNEKVFVAHRRDFRDALEKGLKICSKYSCCDNNSCEKFHIKKENLCPHAGRNNYCTQSDCDKIVIKACRKGKRCHDPDCSFRH